ncbi:RelA/SpoT family protein [Roseiarcus fermentans]|uniref:RelA/SpoT family protein n=1 Tax=Roseiarcus fermentans TaxID=1473586 RepID=A0A366FB78_9HYPH|nr:hypothetical protein [Roseiarcus fermentans]RBP11220.1 RelA/SpoT family protein [Roseiarcus fermentans]
MPDYIVNVPAETNVVKSFLDAERKVILDDFDKIKTIVREALATTKYYKIYGRNDKQDGEPIKHLRKIRLKFNNYFSSKHQTCGSLWSVPDIIGFTIVVSYPSDINDICLVVDRLIDKKEIVSAMPRDVENSLKERRTAEEPDAALELISSKHGRPLQRNGYFACHYNVKLRGINPHRPTCEIQIKTILHDAWGEKTHDLTYKPSGRTSKELIDNFNLLGDTLAKLDQQSDLVRKGIEREAAPRQQKQKELRRATILMQAQSFSNQEQLVAVYKKIMDLDRFEKRTSNLDEIVDDIYNIFELQPKEACYLLAILADRSNREEIYQQTLEAVGAWLGRIKEPIEAIYARNVGALISFCGGDLNTAIEFAEQGTTLIETIDRSRLADVVLTKFARVSNSLYSSLAYYHADRIGSHDGKIGNSESKCLEYLEKADHFRADLGIPDRGILAEDIEISSCLANCDGFQKQRAFQTLDTDAFVRIQTAQTADEVRRLRRKLSLIYKDKPSELQHVGYQLEDYHDYCARVRLAELEAAEAYLRPSSSNGKRM